MTIHFGDSTSIATATGLGANVVDIAHTKQTSPSSYTNISEGNYTNNVLSISYAAASGSNKLLFLAQLTIGSFNSGLVMRFTQGGSVITGSIADGYGSAKRATSMETQKFVSNNTTCHMMYVHTSPSTSAVTYGIQLAHMDNNTGTIHLNKSQDSYTNAWHGRAMSTFTIIEFK